MKLLHFLLFAGLGLALPTELIKRQSTRNEFIGQPCSDVIFFFVRGTTESGNMGTSVGPPLASGLEDEFGADRVAVQGIDYPAAIITNILPENADPRGVATFVSLANEANSRCPNSIVVASGYSQGAAIIHAAFDDLSAAVKNQIAGVVLFGDTRNQQSGGTLPGYPANKLKIICNTGDLVCSGTLIITAAHLAYVPRVPEAVDFLSARITAAGG